MKQIQIALNFQANTKQAQSQMQQLSHSLNNIITNKSLNLDSSSISKASQAASELQFHLSKAVNVDTGKLDLSKFNASLLSAKTNFSTLSASLLTAGDVGQQAFVKLATAIASAQQPALTLSSTMKKLGGTLMNTVRWQISSTAINSVIRSFTTAWNYAKDLNRSLTDIRIVTGQSANEMKKFAEYSNKAAKNLSASTLDFTKASLIYFQQGLSEKEVKERAETTVKMANVTGASMEEVSNQLTAIWNNFDDGSKSLEYYVDVVTALGAATASSSKEIATGLEKFAAVAETVGLSYEYATAALATVTAETRQSAEVVGTAFKTMLARIQDLELGKTLEDGVSLGKYSQALDAVGVHILQANGEVKEMNTILDEMGAKWTTLNKAQQISLAQTVAGVRQYTHLISLMENWDKVKQNVTIAELSEGTLQAQADIYAESWDGASKRVKASMQGIWQQLLDDKVIIGATNAIAEFVGAISNVIKGMGGLKGIILGTLPLIAQLIISKVVPSVELLKNSFLIAFKQGHKVYQKISDDFNKGLSNAMRGYDFSAADQAQLNNAQKLLQMKTQLSEASRRLGDQQKLEAQMAINAFELQSQNQVENIKELETAEKALKDARTEALNAQLRVEELTKAAQERAKSALDEELKNLRRQAEEAKKQWEIIRGNITGVSMSNEAAIKFKLQKTNLQAATTKANANLEKAKASGDIGAQSSAQAELNRAISNQAYFTKITSGPTNLSTALEGARASYLNNPTSATAMTSMGKSMAGFINSTGGDVEKLKILQETISNVYSEAPNLRKVLDEMLEGFIADSSRAKKSVGELSQEITKALQGSGTDSRKMLGITSQQVTAENQARSQYKKEQGAYASHSTQAAQQKFKKDSINSDKGLLKAKEAATAATEKETTAQSKVNQVKQEGEKINKNLQNSYKRLQNILSSTTVSTQQMTKGLTSSFSGLAFSLSSLSSIASTLTSPDISAWQKFISLSMSLTMLAPSLTNMASGITTFVNGMRAGHAALSTFKATAIGVQAVSKGMTSDLMKETAMRKLNDNEITKNLSTETKEALIKTLSSNATRKEKDALIQKIAAEELDNTAEAQGTAITIVDTAAEEVHTAATEADTAATLANYAAKFWLIAIIVAVIAALTALAVILIKNADAEKNLENQLKASSKAYEQITENLKNAREEYENLKTSIDAIEETQSTIDNMVAGTREWKQAVIELNSQIIDLLNKYPDLAQFITSQDGVLSIGQEGFDFILNKQQETVNNLAQGQILAGMQKARNQYRLDWQRNEDDLGDDRDNIINQMVDEHGNIKALEEVWEELKDWYPQFASAEEFKVLYEEWLTELLNTNKIKEEYEAQLSTWTDLLASSTLANNKTYQETDYKNFAEAVFKDIFSQGKIEDIDLSEDGALIAGWDGTDTYKGDLKSGTIKNLGEILQNAGVSDDKNIFLNNSASDVGNKWNNEHIAKYIVSQVTGVSADKIGQEGSGAEVQYRNTGGDGFKYKTKDGEWETLYYEDYDNVLRNYALSSYAEAIFDDRMKEYQPIVNKLSQSAIFQTEDGAKDIQKIDNVMADYAYGGVIDLSDFTRSEISQLKNDQSLYLTGQKEFDEAFAQGLIDYEENRAKAIQAANTAWSETYEEREQQELGKILSEAEMSTEDFDSYVKALKKTRKELNLTEEEWQAMAKANLKNANGLKKLNDVIEENAAALDKSNKGQASYVTAINDVRDAMTEWLGIDLGESKITEFWENGTITNAINGSTEAIQKLHLEAAKQIVIDMDLEDTQAQSVLNDLIAKVDNLNLKPGMDMDITAAVEKINELLRTNKITAEQAQAYWDRVGFHPEVKFTDVRAEKPSVSVSKISVGSYDESTGTFTPESATYQQTETWATITVPQYGAEGTNVAPYVGHSTTSTPASTKDSKGGGSKPKKNTGIKKSDIIERYKEENDQLDDLTRAYDKASKAADRLYGSNRLKAMQENNKLLKQESDLLMQKAQRGREEYLEEDKQALLKAAGDAGIEQLEFDENGNITNYEEMMAPLYAELKAAYDAAGATIDDKEQEKIDKIQEKITPLEDAIKTYDDTLNEIEDLEDEAKEKFYEWQDNNYEALQLKLEIQLELSEDELRGIEYKLEKWENDFYKRSESANLYGDQAKVHINNSSIYEKQIADLETAFEAGNISEEDYIDGLKEARDGLYEQNEALLELKESMSEYYGETLDMANEEISKYTDRMEHTASVLEHYQNIASILGKEFDYEMMGNFLSGQASIAKDQMEASMAWYDALATERDKKQDVYDDAVEQYGEDSEQAQFAKKELDAIIAASDEAQETMLSNTEAWLEAEKAVVENEMAKIRKDFEKTFAGDYGTFDNLMDNFEKLNTRQEEYLTTTNKIYETNKMMRTASQAMDATDNKAAKQRINNFIKETQSLQEKNKLSKFELEIQQAKYDILMAQIALEEAQNAKSIVRLSRDAEGNFGYVYTADADKVADAEQKVADAENALYNKSLEGQQTYSEKYLSARQEMYNELNDLQDKWLNGEIESEEKYNQLKEQILNHYMGPDGVLTQYSELYGIAVQTDIQATEDYWGKEFGLMTQDTEEWKDEVNDYLDEIETKINGPDGWKSKVTGAHESIRDAMNGPDGSKKATEDLTTASEELRKKLIGEDGKSGLVKALKDEATEVNNATTAFFNQLDDIDNLIDRNEKLVWGENKDGKGGLQAVIDAYKQIGELAGKTYEIPPDPKGKTTPDSSSTGSTGSSTGSTGSKGTTAPKTQQSQPNYNNGSLSASQVKEMQAWYWVEADGKWGSGSKSAADGMSADQAWAFYRENKNRYPNYSAVTKNFTDTPAKAAKPPKRPAEYRAKVLTVVDSAMFNFNSGNAFDSKQGAKNELKGMIKDQIEDNIKIQGTGRSKTYAYAGSKQYSTKDALLDYFYNRVLASVQYYNTGGYTGTWGPEGKLGVLHQKELVLNETDTENFLTGIQMLRSISEVLDRNASLMGVGLSNISAFTLKHSMDNSLQQEVTIHAEFPNVNDHNEIEIAINNLVNQASQYAHKV